MSFQDNLDQLRNKHSLSIARAGYKIFEGYTLPESFDVIRQEIEDFEVYDDDIWVTSFPKCGTTWLQETVWCIANNTESSKLDLDFRFPFIEFSCVFDTRKITPKESIPLFLQESVDFVRKSKRPRFIKTHLPWDLLPKQIKSFEKRPKIFHIARNPKDVCVSYYYHSRLLEAYTGNFDLFWKLFITGKLSWTPFFKTLLSYWNNRHEPNIFFLKFEDMKTDLYNVIRKSALFLNVPIEKEQINVLLERLSFNAMRQNPTVNHHPLVEFVKAQNLCIDLEGKFIRSGNAGTAHKEMTPEILEKFDKWQEESLANSDLKFE